MIAPTTLDSWRALYFDARFVAPDRDAVERLAIGQMGREFRLALLDGYFADPAGRVIPRASA